jgi:hypothetical protein
LKPAAPPIDSPAEPEVKPEVKPDAVEKVGTKAEEAKPAEPVRPAPDKTDEPKPAQPAAPARSGLAQVRCTSTVGGEIASAFVDVDGIRRGSTPLALKLEAGRHELVFHRAGLAAVTREVTVGPGENKRLTVEMKP